MTHSQGTQSSAHTIPDIIVISLPDQTDRRSAVTRQLTALGIPFEFLDAIDGEQGHPLFEKYSSRKASRIGEIPLTPSHLGCYASHHLAWQRCLTENRTKIILEDDVFIFFDEFKRFIEVTPSLPEYLECIRLFKNKSRKTKSLSVYRKNGIEVRKFMRGHKSATGYYLTPSGARKLIQSATTWAEPLDLELDQFWVNRVECYGIAPPCVTNDPRFESSIDRGIDTRNSRKGVMRWKWRFYNFRSRFPRSLHNIIFCIKWISQNLKRGKK